MIRCHTNGQSGCLVIFIFNSLHFADGGCRKWYRITLRNAHFSPHHWICLMIYFLRVCVIKPHLTCWYFSLQVITVGAGRRLHHCNRWCKYRLPLENQKKRPYAVVIALKVYSLSNANHRDNRLTSPASFHSSNRQRRGWLFNFNLFGVRLLHFSGIEIWMFLVGK